MKKKIVVTALLVGMISILGGCGQKSSLPEELLGLTKNVTLGEYKALKAEAEAVTDDAINEYINTNLLANSVTYEQIKEGTIKDGDTVNINYVGKKDGVAFEGGTDDSEKGTNLAIGSNSFIAGFEEGLVGAKVGKTIDLNLTFPEDYGNEELNGAAVVFTVDVNYICGKEIVPELTDEFVAANTEYKTVTDYKSFVNETLTNSNASAAEQKVWTTAIANAKISEYPKEDLEAAITNMLNYYKSMATYYSMDLNSVLSMYGTTEETFNDDMQDYAKEVVAEKLVALSIVEKEKIELTDKIYNEKLEKFKTDYGYETVDALKEAIPDAQIKELIYIELGRQFVLDNTAK